MMNWHIKCATSLSSLCYCSFYGGGSVVVELLHLFVGSLCWVLVVWRGLCCPFWFLGYDLKISAQFVNQASDV